MRQATRFGPTRSSEAARSAWMRGRPYVRRLASQLRPPRRATRRRATRSPNTDASAMRRSRSGRDRGRGTSRARETLWPGAPSRTRILSGDRAALPGEPGRGFFGGCRAQGTTACSPASGSATRPARASSSRRRDGPRRDRLDPVADRRRRRLELTRLAPPATGPNAPDRPSAPSSAPPGQQPHQPVPLIP